MARYHKMECELEVLEKEVHEAIHVNKAKLSNASTPYSSSVWQLMTDFLILGSPDQALQS